MALNLSTRISIPETLTDNDIVPHALQNRLMYWRDVFRMGQFDIGDIAAEVIESVAARGLGINQDRVMDATGNFCGKSGRTVRYYYETAVFYPPDVRQEFNILPFSHFVFARSTGDHWRRVLEYSMVFPGIGEKGLRAEYLRWLRGLMIQTESCWTQSRKMASYLPAVKAAKLRRIIGSGCTPG